MKTSPLSQIVERIRSEQQLTREVPDFDPQNGNEAARFLFVLEAPGPKAVASGFISLKNEDQTARNFQAQLAAAGVSSADIALWNVVPWYLGNAELSKIRGARSLDVKQGLQYLTAVVAAIKNLQCIDQPGVFVPPPLLVLSSPAGGFRARVVGPRDYYVDGPYCNESASVR